MTDDNLTVDAECVGCWSSAFCLTNLTSDVPSSCPKLKKDNKLILDVGCGLHTDTTQRGNVHVDIERPDMKLNNFVLADAHHLPFRTDAFNKVYFMEVIEHVNSPMIVLKEIHRVLKHHGKVYISTPNPLHYRICLYGLRGKNAHDDHADHIHTFLACNIEALFNRIGFHLKLASYVVNGKTHHPLLDRVAFRFLPRQLGGHNLFMVGEKK